MHLHRITIDEPEPDADRRRARRPRVDIRGALEAIRAVPGLCDAHPLAAFNNLLAGVFMALLDAYGLELVSVETWGLLFGGISLAFIAGGPGGGQVRARLQARCASILLGNLVNWMVCSVFAAAVVDRACSSIGMVVWLGLIPVIEAAEQTVLQRSIPFERQGRVFGFAQLVENAAAPVTAFMIGPLAETTVMPFMTDGRGADAIGGWFGTGPERGLALMFTRGRRWSAWSSTLAAVGLALVPQPVGRRGMPRRPRGWPASGRPRP